MPGTGRTEPKLGDTMPPPFDFLYSGRNAAEERLVSALLQVGEQLATRRTSASAQPECGADLSPSFAISDDGDPGDALHDSGGLTDLLIHIGDHLARDARLADMLAQLPEYFGDGDLLRTVYRNLYPSQCTSVTLTPEGGTILSQRQVEVLREAAGGRSDREIAARLGVAVRTVSTHMANIYRKLGVNRPMAAVGRAVAMGYLEVDAYDALAEASGSHAHNFGLFRSLLSCSGVSGVSGRAIALPLGEFGLLLLALAASLPQSVRQRQDARDAFEEVVCELTEQGEIARSFRLGGLVRCGGFAVAPPRASGRGFTPGHLYVAVRLDPPRELNASAIAEFTPEGRFVRVFCGAKAIQTRLVEPNSLAFHPNGCLLATSGVMTDAILAFDGGGAKVRRFASGCFKHIAVSPTGRIYAAQYSSMGCIVKVLGLSGEILDATGGTSAGVVYFSVAANSRGHVLVNRLEGQRGLIDERSPSGDLVRTLVLPGLLKGCIAVDARDRLYVPCRGTADLKILTPDGRIERHVSMAGKVSPAEVVIGAGDRVWLSGPAG